MLSLDLYRHCGAIQHHPEQPHDHRVRGCRLPRRQSGEAQLDHELKCKQTTLLMGRVGGSVVERSLSIPEADGSNPVIGKKYVEYLLSTVIEKTKIKEKDTGKGTFKKT